LPDRPITRAAVRHEGRDFFLHLIYVGRVDSIVEQRGNSLSSETIVFVPVTGLSHEVTRTREGYRFNHFSPLWN